jgi:hypothetical protein
MWPGYVTDYSLYKANVNDLNNLSVYTFVQHITTVVYDSKLLVLVI